MHRGWDGYDFGVSYQISHLDAPEAETVAESERPMLLFSGGKASAL